MEINSSERRKKNRVNKKTQGKRKKKGWTSLRNRTPRYLAETQDYFHPLNIRNRTDTLSRARELCRGTEENFSLPEKSERVKFPTRFQMAFQKNCPRTGECFFPHTRRLAKTRRGRGKRGEGGGNASEIRITTDGATNAGHCL